MSLFNGYKDEVMHYLDTNNIKYTEEILHNIASKVLNSGWLNEQLYEVISEESENYFKENL